MHPILWFKGLSTLGKVIVVAGGALGAIITTNSTAQPPVEPVTNLKTEKPIEKPAEKKIRQPVVTTRAEVETEAIPFGESYINDNQMNKGETRVVSEGVPGEKSITYTITETDGVETNRERGNETVKPPVDKVIAIGTYEAPVQKCDPNYSGGCVPIVSYDLDCPDIGFAVTVIGRDIHRFDRDKDGYGCESYR